VAKDHEGLATLDLAPIVQRGADVPVARRGYNDRREWVKLEEGLQEPFLRRLAAWVKAHPEEFITG